MNKRGISYTVFLSILTVCNSYGKGKKTSTPPNLVFIMADQWHGDAMGFIGKEPVLTPNIDKLVKQGVSFNNAVSSYPVSSPARAMLMTGMYPAKNKVVANCNSQTAPYGIEMSTEAVCWSDVLKDEGYRLGYIGKWHLDAPYKPYIKTSNNVGVAWNEWCPKERRHGFDYWLAYGTYDQHLRPMYWANDTKREDFFYVDQWGPEYEASKAIEYINENKEQPFALVVSMNPPHTAYNQVPQKYKDMYKDLSIDELCRKKENLPSADTKMGNHFRKDIRNYYACITGVDENIGRIIDELKKLDIFDNTIVVITSDHGNLIGLHGEPSKNIYYEESMRIPLIVTYPDKLVPREDNELHISFADMYPSLLSMMGFEKKIPQAVQTFDLSKAILYNKGYKPEFQPYYKLTEDNPLTGMRGIRDNRYTYVLSLNDGEKEGVFLFDREKDPFQMNNIAKNNDEIVKIYYDKLKKWLVKTDDPWACKL